MCHKNLLGFTGRVGRGIFKFLFIQVGSVSQITKPHDLKPLVLINIRLEWEKCETNIVIFSEISKYILHLPGH